jgi:hypothetical protein
MAEAFNHLGYFPFCVGVEPAFLQSSVSQQSVLVEAYSAVINMPLLDAMALYWKARSARVIANFAWAGEIRPTPTTSILVNFVLDVDTELNFYNQSNKQNEPRLRVCFDEEENEPLIASTFPLSGGGGGEMEFYLGLFFDRIAYRSPITNAARAFVKENDQIPQNPEDRVYVNMVFRCRQSPAYSGQINIDNRPHDQIISGRTQTPSILNIIINGNQYSVETLTSDNGVVQVFNPPVGNFEIIINTIEDFV